MMKAQRPRAGRKDERPGLVIGPTSGGADVQLEPAPAGRRGGTRTDRRIESDIRRRLRAHSHAGFGEIVVTVSAGAVRLQGAVEDRATRRVAEQIAEAVAGVKIVDNELTTGATRSRGGPAKAAAPSAELAPARRTGARGRAASD